MNEPKITVVIPTRERFDVLEKSIKTAINQDYERLEILVSDNYSCDETEDLVRSINDTRIKYINTGKRVSMSHNWEFALSHVKDGWVTIIGDDDGLLPESIKKISRVIESTDIQAIRTAPCQYSWPSYIDEKHGRLIVSLKGKAEIRNSVKWLSRVMSGKAGYSELPMLYTGGWVNVSALDKLRKKDGTIYQSCSPDVYSAIAIASVMETYLYLHEPFAINGASCHTTGGSFGYSGLDQTKTISYKKFAAEENISFHASIPLRRDGTLPLSIQALVYESYLQSEFLRSPLKLALTLKADFVAQQLKLIMTSAAGSFKNEVDEWGANFAAVNGLRFEKTQSEVRRARFGITARLFVGLMRRALNSYIVSTPDVPIKDVYEASIAAAVICHVKPNMLQRMARTIGRAIQKYLIK